MIAVIADDFTGAAELAGIGLRYGFKVEIDSDVIKNSSAELQIIATDARSMTADQAYKEVTKITANLLKRNPDWVYKKTDSVLRGHVLPELCAMLKVSGKKKVLLVPSNPEYGRKISNGIYYINDVPLHLTAFSDDPEYAIKTSNVLEMLGVSNEFSTNIVSRGISIDKPGIYVAEASSLNDLDYWTSAVDEEIIPAGASGFFSALLKSKGYCKNVTPNNDATKFGKKFLFVCGSAFSHGRIAVEEARKKGAKVSEMPDNVFYDKPPKEKHFKKWVDDTIKLYKQTSKVIVEINQPVVKEPGLAKRLREETAKLVEEVLNNVQVDELFIDGGATVFAISKKLSINKFLPLIEIAPGVIRMAVENKPYLHITIKPGSYLWPEKIWKFD